MEKSGEVVLFMGPLSFISFNELGLSEGERNALMYLYQFESRAVVYLVYGELYTYIEHLNSVCRRSGLDRDFLMRLFKKVRVHVAEWDRDSLDEYGYDVYDSEEPPTCEIPEIIQKVQRAHLSISEIQFGYGRRLLEGDVDPDYGRKLICESMDGGNTNAMVYLAREHLSRGDDFYTERGLDLLREAAGMGSVKAQCILGMHYLENGDPDDALGWLGMAMDHVERHGRKR